MRSIQAFRSTGLSLATMLVLLAGTSVPAMARMTCLISGVTAVSIGQFTDCHEDGARNGPTISATCCDVGLAQMPPMDFMAGANVLVPLPPGLPIAVQPQAMGALSVRVVTVAHLRGPPTRPGSQSLAEHGVYRL